MNPDDDITNFWLAWRELCAIRLCLDADVIRTRCKGVSDVVDNADAVADDARRVIETTNEYFASLIKFPRRVKALKKYAGNVDDVADYNRERAQDEETREENLKSELPSIDMPDPRSGVGAHFVDGPSLGSVGENPDNVVPSRIEPYRCGNATLERGWMVSEYRDLVAGWLEHDLTTTNAFELVEIDLYREAAKESHATDSSQAVEPMLNGRKLKDYLFEDIGGRPGGLCKNLWGYLLRKSAAPWGISRLRMVANKSFRNPLVDRVFPGPGQGDGGSGTNPASSEETAAVMEVGGAFRKYLEENWFRSFDVTDRVVLCCAFFQYVLSDPFVEQLVPIAKSALNIRKTKRVSEVFLYLRNAGFESCDVRTMLCGMAQKLLAEFAASDETCTRLMEHFEKFRDGAGNL